jgi:hypothetical protein
LTHIHPPPPQVAFSGPLYPLDHVTPEGVKKLGQAVNQFILWNQHEIFLDAPISRQRQRIQLSQTLTSSLVDHAFATPPSQQAAQQLTSPHTEQEAPQQPLQPPKDKKAPQLPSPSIDTEASKDKEASLVQGMLPSCHLLMTQSTRI